MPALRHRLHRQGLAPGATSSDGLLVRPLDVTGADNFTFAVPNNPALTTVILNAQYLSLPPGANSLGLLATSALQLTIGN